MAEIGDLNNTDASNTARFPENQAPSTVNDGARALEGIIARWHNAINGSVASTGTPNAYAVSLAQTLSAYYDGLMVCFQANFTNTGAATLNVDGVATHDILLPNGQTLSPGDIVSGHKVFVIHDAGAFWRLISPANYDTATLYFDDDGAAAGPIYNLTRQSATPAISDVLGQMNFRGRNSAAAELTYAAIAARIVNPTSTSEAAEILLGRALSGSVTNGVIVGAGVYTDGVTGGDKGGGSINTATAYIAGDQTYPLQSGLGTPQATTSGTAFDFTGIRSDARRVTIMFENVSLSSTGDLLIQIGPVAGLETTGYVSTGMRHGQSLENNLSATATNGFVISVGDGTTAFSGDVTLTLLNSSTNFWVQKHTGMLSSTRTASGGGNKALAGALERIRVGRVGTDTFDQGSVNILVE